MLGYPEQVAYCTPLLHLSFSLCYC